MAKKQIVEYIQQAQASSMTKGEIVNNLVAAGWSDADVKDAFAYLNLYSKPGEQEARQVRQEVAEGKTLLVGSYHKWLGMVAASVGYLWLISGLDKLLSGQFISGFAAFLRSEILNLGGNFYAGFLADVVLPNASLFAYIIQYSEIGIGATLLIAGIWYTFAYKKFLAWILFIASIASFVMILNITLSLKQTLPWIDSNIAFSPGISLEYLVLMVSFFACAGFLEDL